MTNVTLAEWERVLAALIVLGGVGALVGIVLYLQKRPEAPAGFLAAAVTWIVFGTTLAIVCWIGPGDNRRDIFVGGLVLGSGLTLMLALPFTKFWPWPLGPAWGPPSSRLSPDPRSGKEEVNDPAIDPDPLN